MHTIASMQAYCHRVALEHGWWDEMKDLEWMKEWIDEYNNGVNTEDVLKMKRIMNKARQWFISQKLLLVITEIVEAFEETRKGNSEVHVYYAPTQDAIVPSTKPEGFSVEIADAYIRLFDLFGFLGIDLEAIIMVKMKYNENRTFRHGGKNA